MRGSRALSAGPTDVGVSSKGENGSPLVPLGAQVPWGSGLGASGVHGQPAGGERQEQLKVIVETPQLPPPPRPQVVLDEYDPVHDPPADEPVRTCHVLEGDVVPVQTDTPPLPPGPIVRPHVSGRVQARLPRTRPTGFRVELEPGVSSSTSWRDPEFKEGSSRYPPTAPSHPCLEASSRSGPGVPLHPVHPELGSRT